MRQIIIDTETTGLEPEKGHRVIEIGCVELVNRQFTGNNFHYYLNPQREVEAEALAVHGITNDFLSSKPLFASINDEFLSYITDAELIAHNAEFDIGFLNSEIQLVDKNAKTISNYASIFDTLSLARKMFPGQRNSLDALCKRYKIDLSGRKLHGALLDAQLLAEVFLLMTGGQINLFADLNQPEEEANEKLRTTTRKKKNLNKKLAVLLANQDELLAHQSLLSLIKKTAGKCLWHEG